MKSNRLYRVVKQGSDEAVLIRATNDARVYRHMAKKTFRVTVATDADIYECGKRGIEIEDADGNESYVRDSHGVLTERQ